MTSGSRRALLYWVLLLLPTLAVGGGVLWLLSREQSRLDAQAKAVSETRRAAVGARARLIAENVELLMGDVQAGLMATLREAPSGGGLSEFLAAWRQSNPLVRDTFVVSDGRGEVAAKSKGERQAWLDHLLVAGAPWTGSGMTEQAANQPSSQTRKAVSQAANNALQVNSNRYNLQEISKLKGGYVPPVERTGWLPWRDGSTLHVIGWREQGDGTVVGVEVELRQVAARLGDILPEGREPGEAYELREVGGVTYRQKASSALLFSRAISFSPPLVTIPISDAVLPAWEVVGYLSEEPDKMSGGVFLALSALLAAGLVAAILAGGILLMRQARRSEEEAEQKTSFVANVSHEFKTPLTTIRLYAELLEQGRVGEADKRTAYLATIGRETQRLTRLVNNVLDFSRLEQGKKRFNLVEFDLTEEVAALLATHEPRINESGLVLNRHWPEKPIRVRSDPDAIGQILINLLDNACKYATAGGEVTVALGVHSGPVGGASGEKPLVAIHVFDRGPGVALEHRKRIFDKFHRVDDTLTVEKSGAGLGLSIARQLARGLGGDLRYIDHIGGGAEFVVNLP